LKTLRFGFRDGLRLGRAAAARTRFLARCGFRFAAARLPASRPLDGFLRTVVFFVFFLVMT
jgi:hypothetical protein